MGHHRKVRPDPYANYTGVRNKAKGARSELIACADLLARGADVYRSVTPMGVDLIALVGDALAPLKIEVRSGQRRAADQSISYATIPKHQQRHDVLAIVLPNGEVHYRGPRALEIVNLVSDKRLKITD